MLPYKAPAATVQQLLLKHYKPSGENSHVQKVLRHITLCRTAALGYHVYKCSNDECNHIKYQYHSCRDRHCPCCGALKKQQWIEARMQELLPVKYYHVVFTLPHELNGIVLGNRKALFKLLFDASAQTLLSFAKDPRYLNALPGIISVLHTWGQQLSFHPHIHCIVSGGGIVNNNKWKDAKKDSYSFLFPVKAMQAVFRGKFLQSLKQMITKGEVILPEGTQVKGLLNGLYQKDWVVYAKAPFGGPHAVIEYLGRYTHKVAISNHRICAIDDAKQTVTFNYKDYRSTGNADNNIKKQMTLSCPEFIRRFEQHILPARFTKIRTYGYLANRNRTQRINEVLKQMKLPVHKGVVKVPLAIIMMEQYGIDVQECPCCKNKTMQLVKIFYSYTQPDDG
jgi:hypothetical protein